MSNDDKMNNEIIGLDDNFLALKTKTDFSLPGTYIGRETEFIIRNAGTKRLLSPHYTSSLDEYDKKLLWLEFGDVVHSFQLDMFHPLLKFGNRGRSPTLGDSPSKNPHIVKSDRRRKRKFKENVFSEIDINSKNACFGSKYLWNDDEDFSKRGKFIRKICYGRDSSELLGRRGKYLIFDDDE